METKIVTIQFEVPVDVGTERLVEVITKLVHEGEQELTYNEIRLLEQVIDLRNDPGYGFSASDLL